MATYKYMTKDGYKVQVESAKRDGSGKNIENNYAKQTGYYSGMGVGSADLADNLTTTTGITDTTSFVFQSSGGQQDIATGYAKITLRGNSVSLNQLFPIQVNDKSLSESGITITDNRDGSYTVSGTAIADVNLYFSGIQLLANHKYLLKGCPSGGSGTSFELACGPTLYDRGNGIITEVSAATIPNPRISIRNGTVISTPITFKPQLFDLTQMFGAGNEPTSVVEFNRLFPLPYYEYNAGTLLSSQTSAYKIVGYNAFNNVADNWVNLGSNYVRTKPIKVIAGQTYTLEPKRITNATISYISECDENGNLIKENNTTTTNTVTIGNNTHYVYIQYNGSFTANVVPTDNICLHLTWSGSKTGYEPYYSFTYTMPNVELRSAGSVYDELKPNGELIRRVGVVDLGTLNWTYQSANTRWYSNSLSSLSKAPINNDNLANISAEKYVANSFTNANTNLIGIALSTSNTLFVYTTDSVNSPTGMFYYELATPTTEQNDAYKYDELGRIDDYGTQEFISEQTIQVPQGAEFFYQKNLKDFLNRIGSRADIDFNPNNIVSKTELQASETQRDTIDTQLKEALGGTLRQVLSAKASIDFNDTAWVDLGSLNWTYSSNSVFYASLSGATYNDINTASNLLCSKYKTRFYSAQTDKTIFGASSTNLLYVKDTDYTDATAFKNAMKGVLLAYEKA